MLIEKNLRRIDRAGDQWIDRDDLTFPFRIQQIPKRADVFRIDELGIVSQLAAARRSFEGKM